MKKRLQNSNKWKLIIIIQLFLLLLVEMVRVVQYWNMTDTKVVVMMVSTLSTYLIKAFFEELKKYKEKK